MKCPQCGSEMPDSAAFCAACGSRTTVASPAPVQTFCQQCGSPTAPGAAFCPKCGMRLGNSAPTPVAPAYAYHPAPASTPRKKGKGLVIAIVVVLIIALGGGVYALFGNQIRKMVLGPKGSYVYIEQNQLKSDANDVLSDIARLSGSSGDQKGGTNIEMQVSLEEAMLGIDPVTAASIENITLRNQTMFDRSGDVPKFYNSLALMAADEPLMTINANFDSDNEMLVVSVPELIAQSISITADDLATVMSQTGYDVSSLLPISGSLSGGGQSFEFDEAVFRNTVNKLIDIMLNNVDSCEMTPGATLEAEGVSAKYDLYTMIISGESAKKMMLQIMEMLRDDQQLFDAMNKISPITNGETGEPYTFDEYQASIQESIDELNSSEDAATDITITQQVYVDGSDVVVGRNLTITDSTEATLMALTYANPKVGDQEALCFSFESPETGAMAFNSSYTVKNGLKTGTGSMTMAGSEMASLVMKDVGTQTVDGEDFTIGKITATIPASDTTGGMPIALIYTGVVEDKTLVIDLSVSNMITLHIRYNQLADNQIIIPEIDTDNLVSVSDQAALSDLMTPDVQQKFMEIASALGIPLY